MTRRKLPQLCSAALAMMLALVLTACSGGDAPAATNSQPTGDDPNAPTYTVTLNPNGGTWSNGSGDPVTVSVKEGKPIDFASNMPEYEGNVLYGWYQADGSPWPGARKVTGNLSLRAKWSVAEETVVYDLGLVILDEPVTLEYDNGVYQFTYVSSIHGGYAQRSGKYTVYESELLAAIEADDGSVQRVIYKAGSNYIDATGTLYAEFYNDGEFELYYDYIYNGARTKYCMNTGYWTYPGYTPPFENTPIPVDETGRGYESAHTDWDTSLLDGGESGGGEGPTEETPDIVTLPGEVIYTLDAENSETMKARFRENGVMTIFMTTYNTDVEKKYLWTCDEENGFVLTLNGGEENVAADNGDGTWSFADGYGNTYALPLEELLAAVVEPEQISTAAAVNSETMFAFFFNNHTVEIKFDLAAYGRPGSYATVSSGQWSYDEENGLAIVLGNAAMELADMGDGTVQFTLDDNTYAVTVSELNTAS